MFRMQIIPTQRQAIYLTSKKYTACTGACVLSFKTPDSTEMDYKIPLIQGPGGAQTQHHKERILGVITHNQQRHLGQISQCRQLYITVLKHRPSKKKKKLNHSFSSTCVFVKFDLGKISFKISHISSMLDEIDF